MPDQIQPHSAPRSFYARSDSQNPRLLPGERHARWQTLRNHVIRVAGLARRLANQTRSDDMDFAQAAFWAGLLHDLGKYRDEFQRMLLDFAKNGRARRTPHAVYGAAWARSFRAWDMALAIYGHHAGLPAFRKKKCENNAELQCAERLWQERALQECRLRRFLDNGPVDKAPSRETALRLEPRVRMLLSVLADADRLDAAAWEDKKPPKKALDSKLLLDGLLAHIAKKTRDCPEGVVKNSRTEVLNACLAAAEYPERLLSLTVPTGGGKTLSAMALALRRALLRPDEVRRIIVVIPYLSIIEQNARVYAEALGSDAITEHHSGSLQGLKISPDQQRFEPDAPPGDTEMHPEGSPAKVVSPTENWDAPIIVTTSVRFFETLFSNHPTDLRRMHNIARSVVILDEVQTLPREHLAPLLSMMKTLSEDWGTTFLFCTATQPAFERAPNDGDEARRWMRGTLRTVLGEKDTQDLFHRLARVKDPVWPRPGEKVSWPNLADSLVCERRVLCIVNTKKHALDLYRHVRLAAESKGLSDGPIFHLSTRMCPAHRLCELRRISKTLQDSDGPCIVISTQLVEAGVDLDFPVVYRAMGPLDSLIQAAGRCDREGLLTAALGKPAGRLVIFEPEDGKSPYGAALDITRQLAASGRLSIHNLSHVRSYFHRLFEGDLDKADIEALRAEWDFPEVSKRFQMIEDRTRAVQVQYGNKSKALLGKLMKERHLEPDEWRLLQRWQVGLYASEFEEARRLGTIEELWENADIWACRESCYDNDTGLAIRAPSPQDLIVGEGGPQSREGRTDRPS